MTRSRVLVLAILAETGMTGASFVLNAQVPNTPGTGPAETRATISPKSARAWQALRRPARVNPPPVRLAQDQAKVPEPATVKTFTYRAPASIPSAAQSPQDPVSIARALQRELTRAGCYRGEINGQWTPATRRAMQAFTERANAKLPIDRPDPVLLALVKSDPHLGCREVRSVATPPPSPVSAAAAPAATAPAATTPGGADQPPMALAGPKVDAAGETSVQPEAPQVAPKRQATTPKRRPARTLDWAAKLWRNPPN